MKRKMKRIQEEGLAGLFWRVDRTQTVLFF